MRQYVVRRLLLFIPTLFGASLLVFVLMRLVPGDIAEILVYQTGSEASAVQKKQIAWAVPLGVVSAVRQNSWLDYAARLVSLSGLSLPLFVTGALILSGLKTWIAQ